eukprot:10267105-Alexandrium_andersonii.AAC.1
MCIRDSDTQTTKHNSNSNSNNDDDNNDRMCIAMSEARADRKPRVCLRCRDCLLYTSDAADDM